MLDRCFSKRIARTWLYVSYEIEGNDSEKRLLQQLSIRLEKHAQLAHAAIWTQTLVPQTLIFFFRDVLHHAFGDCDNLASTLILDAVIDILAFLTIDQQIALLQAFQVV